MVKQELMDPVPSLLDFIMKERLHLPRIRFVNVSLKSTITDHDVVVSVYGPIAELKELLEYNWLKKRQTGYIDLMFTSFCNPDPIDLHQEVITDLKEFSKKYSELEI